MGEIYDMQVAFTLLLGLVRSGGLTIGLTQIFGLARCARWPRLVSLDRSATAQVGKSHTIPSENMEEDSSHGRENKDLVLCEQP
jgi:hypothetical protein